VPTPAATPRKLRRALIRVLAGFAVLTLTAVVPATQAHATPSPTEVEAQIDQVWAQLEPLVEQYNGVHYQLTQNQAKQAALLKQMGPLQTQVDLAEVRVGAMSAQLYMHGPGSDLNALLESGSPATLADQLSALNELARQQQETVAQVKQQVDQYASQKQALDLLVAQQQKQDADLAAKKNTIQAQLNQLEQLRTAAYGASGAAAGGSLKPVNCPFTYIGGAGGKAAQVACSLIGHPYGWGDAGPTYYDCSGLTMAAWRAAGKSLPHNAASQWSVVAHIGRSQLAPGDLVFYSGLGHVAIYVGGGQVIHAPHPGTSVQLASVDMMTPYGYGRVR
jgi:cell wall-associated NlpC family hydrolase